MSQPQSQKSFIQFRYCPLCRSNHKRGKKHVFTERHQQIVKNVLTKFAKKTEEAKMAVEKPVVQDVSWGDAARQFWCYFCQSDVDRHKNNTYDAGSCVVEHGGLLEHIVRKDHVKNTISFLKENRVDMKRTSEFVLTSEMYIKFLENVEKAVALFFKSKAYTLQKISYQIRIQSAIQQQIVSAGLMEQNIREKEKQVHGNMAEAAQMTSKSRHGDEEIQRKKTAQAFGNGLTAIDRSKEDDSLGNIYTNAIPPWMRSAADDEEGPREIGPTLSDLEKHRKLEKKAKLPAGRVGAKFDHSSDVSDTWMPSFGGVWHHSRRTDSVKQFHRRQVGKQKPSSIRPAPYPPPPAASPSLACGLDSLVSQLSNSDVLPPPRTKEFSPAKFPRATATAPAPWNRYLSKTAASSGSLQLASSTVPSAAVSSDHDVDPSTLQTICHPFTCDPLDSRDAELKAELTPSIKPYVSKRKKQAALADTGAVQHQSGSSTYSPYEQHSAGHWQNSVHPYRSHNTPMVHDPHRHLPTNHFPSRYHAHSTNSSSHPLVSSHHVGFSKDTAPASGYNRFSETFKAGNMKVIDHEIPVAPFSSRAVASANVSQQPLRLISTPLLQTQNKKSS